MSRRSWARPGHMHRVLGPFSPADRWWTTSNVGSVALVGGLFRPWRNISYFSAERMSDGVLGLPGGIVYGVLVAAFVIAAICGAARRSGTREALWVIGLGLAGYSAFWLVGGMVLDVGIGFSFAHPTVGSGLLLSFAGSLLMVWMLRSAGRRASTASQEPEGDLFLPDETDGLSGGVASREAFLDRLHTMSQRDGHETVPLVFVRLDGLDEIRRRHGSPAADRISVAMTHRLRAHLRSDDTVASLVPGEVFILLSGEASEAIAMAVVRRLEATLAQPIPLVKGRQAKRLTVTVQLARAALTSSRFRIVAGDEDLVDAPVASAKTGLTA